MSTNVKIDGLKEILDKLAKTELDMEMAKRKANVRGGEVVAEELRKQAPFGKGNHKYSNDGHMRDRVVMSNNKRDKGTDESYIEVGFPTGTAWRTHFPLGTIKQAPNPYFDRTITNSASAVNRAMAEEIKKVLR